MQQQAGLREKRLQTPVWFSVQHYTDTGGQSTFYTTWRNISVLMQDFHFDENNCSFSSQCPCNGITDLSDKVLVWAVDFSQSQIHVNLNPRRCTKRCLHSVTCKRTSWLPRPHCFLILWKLKFLYRAFVTFQLAFISSVSLFNKVFWFIADGRLYFVLIIGCYWKDEFHWFCGWLGALPSQSVDCQQGLCWGGIDAAESPPSAFLFTSVSIDWNMQ